MKAILPSIALTLTACVSSAPVSLGPTAGLGQTAAVDVIRIRPIKVVEDSRCPTLVRCVWEGRITVRARMNGPGWTQIRDFQLGVPQAVDQFRVALVQAEPPKAAPGEIDRRAYRFTFAVSRR